MFAFSHALRSRTAFRIGSVAAILSASACSLVNAFDDVKPLADGTYSPAPAGSNIGDASVTIDGGGGGSPDSTPPGSDAATGAIVVGGQVDVDGAAPSFVLAVLDPATGREIATREKMVVAAVRYDGLRDLWYVFESKSNEWAPGPNAQVIFHVRQLNLATGVWTELASIGVPPIQNYESIGVLRERVSYVAYQNGGPGIEIVTLTTTNPDKPDILDQQLLDRAPLGMVATRSGTGPGGTIGLVRMNTTPAACTGNICSVELVRVRVPNGTLPEVDAPTILGQAPKTSIPGYATFTNVERDVIVFPRLAADASTMAALFEPVTQSPEGPATPFLMTDTALRRAAVAECTQTAFVVGTNGDLDLHAVPVFGDGGGTPSSVTTGHSGQSVYYEPTSHTVLAPFSQGEGFDLSAFRLSGTADAPALARRTATDWNPPVDLRPILLAVRLPVPIVCP